MNRYYDDLAKAIVLQAVKDWRTLTKGYSIDTVTYGEIRAFFNSKWCLMLVSDPQRILKHLEKELRSVS